MKYDVDVSGGQGNVVGDYATVFQNFTSAPAPLSSHIRVPEFRGTIDDRTRAFVGRDYVFNAIDAIIRDDTFPSGYILLQGEPGIGKTAVLAQLVRRRGWVHHLNIAPLGIRSPQAFLSNVCAQLIVRHGLGHAFLPESATRDGGFLARLLSEVSDDPANHPVVVVVDALDEAQDDPPSGANRLFLPPSLPTGVYFLVSTRPQYDYQLYTDHRRDIYLRDDDPQNLDDVRTFVTEFMLREKDRVGESAAFADLVVERSEGNFMYVVHVLRDILRGDTDLSSLPQGLWAYYRRHWDTMRARQPELFARYQEPTICLLATAREPVTLTQIADWARQYWVQQGWDPATFRHRSVVEVVRDWQEFLNVDGDRYRIYHASFQDYLREEIGLVDYHSAISAAAIAKIPGFPGKPDVTATSDEPA